MSHLWKFQDLLTSNLYILQIPVILTSWMSMQNCNPPENEQVLKACTAEQLYTKNLQGGVFPIIFLTHPVSKVLTN